MKMRFFYNSNLLKFCRLHFGHRYRVYSQDVVIEFFLFVFVGAHSHIRGLGLDDALEARQVCL